jgi:3-dehydroquinate dehydratase
MTGSRDSAGEGAGLRIAVVHGPNLRLLGLREPDVYGPTTLDEVNASLRELAGELGGEVEAFQSKDAGEILDFLEEASARVDGFLVNPGGLGHTSVALRDALVGVVLKIAIPELVLDDEAYRTSLELLPSFSHGFHLLYHGQSSFVNCWNLKIGALNSS